jgi:hypothetical protein
MKKILIIIALLIFAIIIIFFFDRKNITENFTNNIASTPPTTTPAPSYSDIINETNEWVKNNSLIPPATLEAATPPATPPATPATPPATPATPPAATTPATPPAATPPTTPPTTTTPPIIDNPQIMNPVGETQQQQQPIVKEVSIVDFLSVILTYTPWGAYYAGNLSTDNTILLDLINRSEKNAVITGNITKNISSGNGAIGNVSSILGTTNTTIEFPNNSIPEKFTICSITRYTGAVNNKRILTAKNATPTNDWIHGHKSGQKGVVYYNEFKTNNSPDIKLAGELTDWVITCAKNDGTPPNNIYINGSPSGVKSGGNGGLKLAINKIDNTNIINELSDFALSYVIIWDSCLSDKALKIISDSLVKYLKTGEHLLFDISSLSTDDKFKVADAKTSFLKGEIDETNAALLEIKKTNSGVIANAINSVIATTAPQAAPTTISPIPVNDAAQTIISLAASAANKLGEQKIGDGSDIKNLNPSNSKIIVNNVCNTYTFMPDPDAVSFTEPAENIPISSDNKSYQSYIWCKCDGDNGINNNTDNCKAYNLCRENYATYKNSTNNDKNMPEIQKEIYNNCLIKFPNFPKYLEVNSLK